MSWGNQQQSGGWGNSGWGNSGCGSSGWGNGGWGNSGWGKQKDSESREPNGQHHSQCIAGQSGWGNNGVLGGHYDAKCSGCERDRAGAPWGSKGNKK